MNEEIEYAEMLEIPVSTVNVVKKRRRRKVEKESETAPLFTDRKDFFAPSTPRAVEGLQNPLQDSVIAQVNDRVQDSASNPSPDPQPSEITADAALFAESANSEGTLDFDIPDRIDTVRVYANAKPKRSFFKRRKELDEQEYTFEEAFGLPDEKDVEFENEEDVFSQNEGGMYELKEEETPRAMRITMVAEFAAACALCGAIFLTNVFMPSSAINTFFRALSGNSAQTADSRVYTDFTLSPVVSELSGAELHLSDAGVLTFTSKSCVYPAANGTISEIAQAEDGTYRIKISHSDSFTGVIGGLDYVYYAIGDEVKSNVPVGFSNGETEVQVTMYSGGTLLNCFELTEENCLAWVTQE